MILSRYRRIRRGRRMMKDELRERSRKMEVRWNGKGEARHQER